MLDNLDELRHIEGFPIGKDEDLLALSNPPYYTAYPNPHIAEFIKQYGKPYDEAADDYHREPFVTDVSEGRSGAVYNAHSYHTKVPFEAIVPFIEHYTQPGEVIFDGFCGSGMAGVAAQYSKRHSILCDLAPLATFVAFNYTQPVDVFLFEREAKRVLSKVDSECGWLYETNHKLIKGRINFILWSDVFICPYCGNEVIFWDVAIDFENGKIRRPFFCSTCKADLTKYNIERAVVKVFDKSLGREIELARQEPVLINYSVGKKRFEKKPDENDLALITKISESEIPYWYPTNKLPDGQNTQQPIHSHRITNVHHFYTKRNLWVLAALRHYANQSSGTIKSNILFAISSYDFTHSTKMSRVIFKAGEKPVLTSGQSGTLYIPSISVEKNVINGVTDKISAVKKAFLAFERKSKTCLTTQSATDLRNFPENFVDYIFTDPPFGANLMYSELNFLWESWLGVFTNNKSEAIMNSVQRKELSDYRNLMTEAFSEMCRILKPGRWITVEFHNSKASVWNAIQDALMRAGFVVAQVTVLDKQQGSFKQVTSAGAVKNDLVINAYKPRAGFTQRLISQAGHGLETDFVREHLRQLPIAANAERSKEMLYSKYLAYYVQHGFQVAYNSEQFYRALSQWGLEERDIYWFADEIQAHEYEQRKVKTFGKKGIVPQAVLFVSDERSARQWVWNFLNEPKTYDEIYTAFVKALQTSEDEIPELKIMLEESFVRTNGHWKRPDQLTQAELEQKRLERLLHQFNEYLEAAKAGQKLKEVRREAVLAGFTECYRTGRFQDILTLGHKLDKRLLEESQDLFDFVDIAAAKVEI